MNLPVVVNEKNLFVRTVTYHTLGRLERIENGFLILSNSSWVADTGRFGKFITEGISSDAQIEYTGKTIFINMASIVDIYEWEHDLPIKTQ